MKIWAKTKEFSEGKFLVVRRDGSVPHWPHFVLGARDAAAPYALRAYANECARQELDPAYVESVMELARDFERYADQQGPGDPDAAPHRQDDLCVLAAMRGHESHLYVRPDQANAKKRSPMEAESERTLPPFNASEG